MDEPTKTTKRKTYNSAYGFSGAVDQMQESNKVKVTAPAHLHTGNFDMTGDLGRLYGTVGFAVDRCLEIEVAKADEVKAKDEAAFLFTKRFVETKLYGLKLTTEKVALAMKRGAITSLGVHAFKVGGFIVEGGFRVKEREKMIPPLIFHQNVPDNWLFVIAIANEPQEKIIKMREDEDHILRNLKLMPKETSDMLSRIVLVKILPSIVEGDLKSFGEGLTAFNSELGKFWNEYQCGRTYCHPVVEEAIKIMLKRSTCACQTSWGPTIYGIVDRQTEAETLKKELENYLAKNGGEVFYTKANNVGAVIGGE